MYIFDPALKHLADAVNDRSQPGKRIKFTSRQFASSHQLLPYNKLFNFVSTKQYDGSIFRFPFREHPSQISSDVYDVTTVNELRDRLRLEGSKMLLFLKNVNRITFSTIHQHGELPTEEFVVQRNDKSISSYGASWKFFAVQSDDFSESQEKWLVSEHSQDIYCSTSYKMEYSVAAVACQVVDGIENKATVQNVSGEVFCFLPLSVYWVTGACQCQLWSVQ